MAINLNSFSGTYGRVATEEDVNNGHAVFILKDNDGEHIGEPMAIDIPQFCIHTDEDTGEKTTQVLIQAEQADDKQYCGLVDIEKENYSVCLRFEIELLGSNITGGL